MNLYWKSHKFLANFSAAHFTAKTNAVLFLDNNKKVVIAWWNMIIFSRNITCCVIFYKEELHIFQGHVDAKKYTCWAWYFILSEWYPLCFSFYWTKYTFCIDKYIANDLKLLVILISLICCVLELVSYVYFRS
jgi:hypothetical protein